MNARVLTRELRFEPPAAGLAQDAPIPATIATSSPVMRYGVAEVLDCSSTGVDLSRAPLPLIVGHDSSRLSIGLVENLTAHGDRVTGDVRFATSPEAQQVRADVIAGIHRSLSVGYALIGEGAAINGGFMYQWQPHEVSIVPIPADPLAGFFRSLSESQTMPTKTPAAEIIELCTRHNMPELAASLNRDGATLEVANRSVLDELAKRDRASGGHLNVSTRGFSQDANAEREVLVNSLVARLGGKPVGEVIRSTDCTGLAVRALEMRGHAVNRFDSRDSILVRAMGTSDFPQLLGNAAGRVLLAAFEESPSALKQIARMNNLANFKDRTVLRMPGGAPSLEKVNESGEFTHGSLAEEANAWRLYTFGRIISLSRQALVNDDLSAFSGLLADFGKAAARLEADELVSVLTGTPLVGGAALFSTGRSSLVTTAALAAATLASAVTALRLQKETGGGFIIQEPAYLVVPAALENTARQLVANITPATTAAVQPYNLAVVVEPRLDAVSATTWYLVSGNQSALEYGYLDGASGPQTFTQDGWAVDGTEFKCRLDFGCGWVAPIGWVKATA